MTTVLMASPTSTLSKALLAYQKTVVTLPGDDDLTSFQKQVAFNCLIGNYYDIIMLVKAIARSIGIAVETEEYNKLRSDFATFYGTCQGPISYGCFMYHCIDTVRTSGKA